MTKANSSPPPLAPLTFALSFVLGLIVLGLPWASAVVQAIYSHDPPILAFGGLKEAPSFVPDQTTAITLWGNHVVANGCPKSIIESDPPSAIKDLSSWQTIGRGAYVILAGLWVIFLLLRQRQLSTVKSLIGIGLIFITWSILLDILAPTVSDCTSVIVGVKLKEATPVWASTLAIVAGIALAFGAITAQLIARHFGSTDSFTRRDLSAGR